MFNNFEIKAYHVLKNMEEERHLLHHPFVGSEHLFLSLLKFCPETQKIMKESNLSYQIFKEELVKIVGIPKKNVDFNLYTPLLKRVISNSIDDAKENNNGIVTTKHLFFSILEEGEGVAIRILLGMDIDLENIQQSLDKKVITKKENICDFGKNLNLAVNMEEKTVGREKELKYIIETLLRKKKNNPLLIGPAGVGKTAIIEELARKINSGEVPEELQNTNIISIEMADLVAGTKYRGEFEEKLNKIIDILGKDKSKIIFIDEIHSMVKAGGAEGAISAGDIFKPYLARGDIKCIGATTTDEYDRYISKDKALARRFEIVNINEPTDEDTINILCKIKKEYENHHNVKISKKMIEKIVEYSGKYIFSKKNPDKSIDFMDSICTMVKVKNDHSKKINNYLLTKKEIEKLKDESIIQNDFNSALKYSDKEKDIDLKIANLQNNFKFNVTEKDILKVLSYKSNVPLLIDKKKLFNNIKNNLTNNIIGQDEVINKIIANLNKKFTSTDQILSLLFLGSIGVGKTEIVKLINESFANNINFIKIEGSEYSNEASITKLIGSSAGYIGYEDTFLFNKIKYNPYALILVEDIDKLSVNVLNLFKQILTDGYITDAKGNVINFNNSIVIMTKTINQVKKVGFNNELFYEENNELNNIFNEIIIFNKITEKDILEYAKKHNLDVDLLKKYEYENYGFKKVKNELKKIFI